MSKKVTLRQAMSDFTNFFLCKMLDQKVWKREDIEHEFFRAMYMIALDYLEEDESKKPI